MYGEASNVPIDDMWSLSPTGSDALDPYCRVDFKSTDLNILTEGLQRLDGNIRELRTELLHHADLVHAVVADVENVFSSELSESLNGLFHCVAKVEDKIDLVVRQVDLERNDRSVQQRIIQSLRATLTEADRQLEHAALLESQLHVTQDSHCLTEQRLTHTDMNELAEPSRVDLVAEGNMVSATGLFLGNLPKISYDDSSGFSDNFPPSHPKVPKQEQLVGCLSPSSSICQKMASDFESGDNTRGSPGVLHRSHARCERASHSLDRFSGTGEQHSMTNLMQFRSRSVDSFSDSCERPRYDTKLYAVFQTWLVQRIQLEMRKRHQLETLLSEAQRELERLRATEVKSLEPFRKMNKTEEPIVLSNNAGVENKVNSVQEYLFESATCVQLPVVEGLNTCSSHVSTTKSVDCEASENPEMLPQTRACTRPLSSRDNHLGRFENGQRGAPLPVQCVTALHGDHPFRRYFSEPDLVVSCRSTYFDTHFPSLSPASHPPKSKQQSQVSSFASARRCKSHSASDNTQSNAHVDPESFMYKLVSFLRQSSDLLLRLTWSGTTTFYDHPSDQFNLHSHVRKYGEHLEHFRSYVLRTQMIQNTSLCKHSESFIFPLSLCQLLHLSNESESTSYSKKDRGIIVPKRHHTHTSIEQMISSLDLQTNLDFASCIWKEFDEILLPSDNRLSSDNLIESLVKRLNYMDHKLREQMEQCNELEALLAERDGRIAAQASELLETEAHLAASTETVASLHKQILSSNRNWTQTLQRIQSQVDSDPSRPDIGQLPALPVVLDLVRNLDTAYAELQKSENCRILAEQRATSALTTARRLRCQLRDSLTQPLEPGTFAADLTKHSLTDHSSQTEDFPRTKLPVSPTEKISREVGVQSSTADDNDNINHLQGKEFAMHNEILRFGFSRPKTALEHPHASSSADQVSELREALKNAVAQVDRLQKYRVTQKARYEQLQQRFLQINSELDATVDVFRHHQTSNEVERRRTAVELSQLRTQLAKANSLLDHYRTLQVKSAIQFQSPSTDRGLLFQRADEGQTTSRSSAGGKDRPDLLPSCSVDDLALQLSMTRAELSQLKSDIAEQKAAADRETTNLRGQLAEASADARSLRLQISRLQVGGSDSRVGPSVVGGDSEPLSCSTCQRLQRLLDLLQAKSRSDPVTTLATLPSVTVQQSPNEFNSTSAEQCRCDRACQTDISVEQVMPTELVQSNRSETLSEERLVRWQKELSEFEKTLRDKDIELQKENGRLSFEADRLKRKQEAIVHRESKLQEDVQLHESQVESQRVELQNNALQLSRERTVLTHERQAVESERARFSSLEKELMQKRREAELLIELVTKAHIAEVQDDTKLSSEEISNAPVLMYHQSPSPSDLKCSVGKSHVSSQDDGKSEHTPAVDKFERSITFLFDWLEKSLLRMDMKLLFEQSDQFSNDQKVIVTRMMHFLMSDMRKLRAQLAMGCEPLPARSTVTDCAQSSTIIHAIEHYPVDNTGMNTEQLLRRLHAAEKEAQEATEQLKSSNTEFLTLRERLSHAMVERAHLKATVDGLDEEVSRLQSSLYERTQQLSACQVELARYTGRVSIPMPTEWPTTTKETLVPVGNLNPSPGLQFAIPEATVIALGPVSNKFPNLSNVLRKCRFWSYQHLDRIYNLSVSHITGVPLILQRLSTITRCRLRLQSQPRPRLIFGFIIYLLFMHFLLLRYWLL
ncbi:hypothetical protein D915_000718 [Fasciola hepatica]|uniref:Uncharacterized protein n=1 Tax=Fasciola hepatica TaxID=6192 RepID=A0A4E0RJN1_FASHE|nr:hypothetical protein D915_000718 [Fasciola hepatica]